MLLHKYVSLISLSLKSTNDTVKDFLRCRKTPKIPLFRALVDLLTLIDHLKGSVNIPEHHLQLSFTFTHPVHTHVPAPRTARNMNNSMRGKLECSRKTTMSQVKMILLGLRMCLSLRSTCCPRMRTQDQLQADTSKAQCIAHACNPYHWDGRE